MKPSPSTNNSQPSAKDRCLAAYGTKEHIKNNTQDPSRVAAWCARVFTALNSEFRFRTRTDWDSLLCEINSICTRSDIKTY